MQTIDIIIAVLLALGLISGLRAGLVKQVCSLVGLIAGLLVARALYLPMGDWLTAELGTSPQTAHIVAFILLLVIVPLLFSLVGWLVSKILGFICLGWLNRLLGGVIGIAKYALLAGVVLTAIELFDGRDALISQSQKDTSVFYYPIYNLTSIFFDEVKDKLGTYVPV